MKKFVLSWMLILSCLSYIVCQDLSSLSDAELQTEYNLALIGGDDKLMYEVINEQERRKQGLPVPEKQGLPEIVEVKKLEPEDLSRSNSASDFTYDITADGSGIEIFDYIGNRDIIVIPELIEGIKVTEVKLTENFGKARVLVFPDTVKVITGRIVRRYELYEMNSRPSDSDCPTWCVLEKVVLPKKLKEVPESAFFACGKLKEVIFPQGLEIIGNGAFGECGITSLVLPPNLKSIGDAAFTKCPIEHLELNKVLKRIEMFTFCYSKIKTLVIPDNIAYIGAGAFGFCTELTSVTVPNKKIEYKSRFLVFYSAPTFFGCDQLSMQEKQKLRNSGYRDAFTGDIYN